MVESTTDPTVELTPLDLLRYVEGDRPAGVIRLPDGLLCFQFGYNIESEYEYEAGETNYEMAPVLNSRGLQTLIGLGALRYTHTDTDTRFFVVMVEGREDITNELKEAFHVHDERFPGFGGKDPRRVWNEYADVKAAPPTAGDYLPLETDG